MLDSALWVERYIWAIRAAFGERIWFALWSRALVRQEEA